MGIKATWSTAVFENYSFLKVLQDHFRIYVFVIEFMS
jgi:hypothetical protein